MKKSEEKTVLIPEMNIQQIAVQIIGNTPLIVNKFSEKAKTQMLEKQMKKATKGKEAKNPEEMYLNSIYWFADKKRTGFPAVGFKAAMVRAAKQIGMIMTDTRGMFHVVADEGDLIEIIGKHRIREDMVRLQSGVADVRFRAEYPEWSATVNIQYNATVISDEQLTDLLKIAGFSCGIGEWRPEKSNSGSFGLFRLK